MMRLTTLLFTLGICSIAFGQSWQKQNLSNSYFIEDIGQCAEFEKDNNVDVKYMMYGSSTIFYIHNKGFSVHKSSLDAEKYMEEKEEFESSLSASLTHKEREDLEHAENAKIYSKSIIESTVHYWNDGFDIIQAEKADQTAAKFHFTRSNGIQLTNAKEYQTISCINSTTGAIVEFFSKEGGLKYNVTLENQDALTQFHWTIDDGSQVFIGEDNQVYVNKGIIHLNDQAPTAFLNSGAEIPVAFNVDNNTVSFIAENISEWPLTIDPWVTDLDSLLAEVLNVETDESANIYVYLNTATTNEDEVRKYTSNGTLLWSNIFYANSITNGDLEIDHEAGTIFLSAIGSVGKYDENGISLWTTAFNEAWTLEFNCSENQFIGGGNWGINGSKLHNLDAETGEPLSAFLLPNDNLVINDEVRSATSSPAGDYYFLSLQHVLKMCAGMRIDYQIPNGHTPLSYFGPDYLNATFGVPTRGELNAIAVDSQYLYTYDGRHLIQRLSASGVFVNDTMMPSGIIAMNGGIIVDDCGFVYLGTQTHVYKLDNAFNVLDSISVTTPVFDLAFNDSNQILITGVDNLTSATFEHCFKQLCSPPDTFPYSLTRDTVICAGDSFRLSASGGDSYSWFPNTNITSLDSSSTVVYPDTTTTYGVVIKFDSCNYRIGYIRVFVDTNTKYVLPNDTTICEGDSVSLFISGTAPSFLVEDTFNLFSDTGTLFNLKPTESTFYRVTSIGLDSSGCSDDYNITVLERPFASEQDSVLQCNDIPVEIPYTPNDSVTWFPDDGITFGDSIATIFKEESGFIFIEQKNYGVCRWLDSFYLSVLPGPDVMVDPYDSVICIGDQLLVVPNGAVNYSWYPDSIVQVLETGFLLAPKDSLSVKIIGEDAFGCLDSTNIRFYTKPQADARILLNDTTVCYREPIVIHVAGDDSLYWDDDSDLTRVGLNSYRYVPQDYRELAIVSSPEGFCPDTGFLKVLVHKISVVNELDTTICRGESVLFKPTADGKYSIFPNSGVQEVGENEFLFSPYTSMEYLLMNDFGCVGNDSLKVKVIDCSYFVPNVVTPDGDGNNDRFFIKSDIIESANGKIYNRWGNKVYDADLQAFPWDCKKGNQTAPDGTYFYSIDVITKEGESFKLRGEFTLFSE